MISEDIRKLIVSQHLQGKRCYEIHKMVSNFCGYHTVRNVVQRWNENKTVERNPYPPKKKTPERQAMEKRIVFNLCYAQGQNSIRGQARKEGVSRTTVSRILRARGLKVYKKVPRPNLSGDEKSRRKICSGRFRKRFQTRDIPWMIFVDECYVVVGEYFNRQNERCYGKSFDLIPDYKKFKRRKKSPLTAMIFGAVWRGGRSDLVVLPSGFRLNQHTYKEECLIPLLENLPDKMSANKVILYQDKAPCHKAKSVQTFLEANAPCFIRNKEIPPNSPDLNPLDYGIWAALKVALEKHKKVKNFNHLKKLLIKEWSGLPQELLRATIDSWLVRCRRVDSLHGDFFD